MATVLERVTAEISRNAEYFSVKELQAMTGQPQERFAIVIAKELVDNALDGCESSGVQPDITLDWAGDDKTLILSVADNGKGIPPEIIDRILDFSVRVSDKVLYRSPSRGAQGNALKTVIGMPFALGSDSPVIIDSRGVRHAIRAWVDPLGAVMVDHHLGRVLF
jgi:DNA topoisomerase VI subunit B